MIDKPEDITVDTPIGLDHRPPSLYPESWEEFVGRERELRPLVRLLQAAKARKEQADHVLLVGPPGTGKTAAMKLVAKETGAVTVSPYQLTSYMWRKPGQVAVVDEIHAVPPKETVSVLLSMADPRYPVTIVGATNRPGRLPQAIRDRFGLEVRFDYYCSCLSDAIHAAHGAACSALGDMPEVVRSMARKLGMELSTEAVAEIAARARGVPRIAGRLLKRVRDLSDSPTPAQVREVVEDLRVDPIGLSQAERTYLETLAYRFHGGPIGAEGIAKAIGEEKQSVQEVIEPYLLRLGLIAVGSRGRVITPAGRDYLYGLL